MSDEDDYVPNAEDNLSIMSDADKSEGHSDIDIDEINDVLLKNLESDVFNMQNEVKQRDSEMRRLLEDLQKRFYAEKDSEFAKVAEEYQETIRNFKEKTIELESQLKYEREQSRSYFNAVDTLENENEKLKSENEKQRMEIAILTDRVHKLGMANNNRSTASESGMYNAPPSPIGSHPHKNDKNKPNFVLDCGEDYSQSDFDANTFLKSNDNIFGGHANDEAWATKLEFLREKLVNEQNRSRELEFMIVTQKNIIENSNENTTKLKQENKDLESKIEKFRGEVDKVKQSKILEKTKIDSVITFCELMDNCVFPKSELVEKLSELPIMISNYLKGEVETIAFNKNLSSNSKLVAAGKKLKVLLDQVEENVERGDKNFRAGMVASELDDIRHGITNLTQFLSKAIPSQGQQQNQTQSNHHMDVGGQSEGRIPARMQDFKFAQPTPTPTYQDPNYADPRNNNFKSSFFLARAVQNSNSLLWNFNKAPARNGGRTSSEGRM
jgi:DNA repair exonuclease SbcCD ATPase subunit